MNEKTTGVMDLKVLFIVISVMDMILHYFRLFCMHRIVGPFQDCELLGSRRGLANVCAWVCMEVQAGY